LKRWHWATVAISVLVFGGSALVFEQPREGLIRIADSYPVSAMINMLQHLGVAANNADCLHELKLRDVAFKLQAAFSEPNGCTVDYAVRLARVGKTKVDNAPLLTCRMAMGLSDFEQDTLQPLARRLLGADVVQLKHLGTYNCRSVRQHNGILSQHAFANAIDVSGFVLADGRSINVAKDWKRSNEKSKFLRRVSSGACKVFRVSISPNADANHWNHLHWDMGLWGGCR
jgi:hypothetical protein